MKKSSIVIILSLCINTQNFTQQIDNPVQRKRALITGITGQDGTYLAELLLAQGYEVHGIKRRSSSSNTSRIEHLCQSIHSKTERLFILHDGDLCDQTGLFDIIQEVKPDEIYNLAAQSDVRLSFDMPEYTALVDALGTLRILEAIRMAGLTEKTRFYQASTSELFGKAQEIPQNEQTPFYPRSPYGCAKLYAYWITKNYRESYGMFAVNGILFNHESPLRGDGFVTKKIARGVARIKFGLDDALYLGNLDAKRDWGHARDYVKAMWLMLQQDEPQDLVIATGNTHSVREFVELAFAQVGITIFWQGKGLDEIGYDQATLKPLVFIDKRYFRAAEVDLLIGNPTKAKTVLGWQSHVSFKELVQEMVREELLSLKPDQ